MARIFSLFAGFGLFRRSEDRVLDARLAQLSVARSRRGLRNRVSPFAQGNRAA